MDHDQRFKTLIQSNFAEFIRLFFRLWFARFDYSKIEWLEQEVFPDPPEGSRHVLDLVAKLTVVQPIDGFHDDEAKEWIVLVVIEIDSSDSAATLRRKLPKYAFRLQDKHNLPVLPIALFLKVGLNGIGTEVYEEKFWELKTLRSEFLYVGLPALPALEYLVGDSYLGMALTPLMKIAREEVVRLGAEALRKIQESPLSEQQKFLFCECVQAYMPPLSEDQQTEFDALMQTEPYRGVKAMNLTSYDKGLLKGREEGIEKGIEKGEQRALMRRLKKQLEFKFETEGSQFFEQLPTNLDNAKLDAILDAVDMEDSLDNLRKLLP